MRRVCEVKGDELSLSENSHHKFKCRCLRHAGATLKPFEVPFCSLKPKSLGCLQQHPMPHTPRLPVRSSTVKPEASKHPGPLHNLTQVINHSNCSSSYSGHPKTSGYPTPSHQPETHGQNHSSHVYPPVPLPMTPPGICNGNHCIPRVASGKRCPVELVECQQDQETPQCNCNLHKIDDIPPPSHGLRGYIEPIVGPPPVYDATCPKEYRYGQNQRHCKWHRLQEVKEFIYQELYPKSIEARAGLPPSGPRVPIRGGPHHHFTNTSLPLSISNTSLPLSNTTTPSTPTPTPFRTIFPAPAPLSITKTSYIIPLPTHSFAYDSLRAPSTVTHVSGVREFVHEPEDLHEYGDATMPQPNTPEKAPVDTGPQGQ